MEKVTLVSVVRDREMYSKCISGNLFVEGCELVAIDNEKENLGIPRRYNGFIDAMEPEHDGWVVFCHEDWQPCENLSARLQGLDRGFLYGPVGVFVEERQGPDVRIMRGYVLQSAKDGRRKMRLRGKEPEGRVDTFDCQCIIVHSSLLRRYGLRFDENLTFDMYAEDFCVAAYERFGIESRTILIDCRHFSRGKISDSYRAALEYVRGKYAGGKKRYASIVGRHNTFGPNWQKPVYNWRRTLWRRLRYRFCK